MPATEYHPGDVCWLHAIIGNPGDALPDMALVVMLDIGTGEYWFYPSWCKYPPDIDFDLLSVPHGYHLEVIIPEFRWPEGAGAADGLVFWGALLDKDLSAVQGEMGSWRFAFGE